MPETATHSLKSVSLPTLGHSTLLGHLLHKVTTQRTFEDSNLGQAFSASHPVSVCEVELEIQVQA
jgi:hypothetical protein